MSVVLMQLRKKLIRGFLEVCEGPIEEDKLARRGLGSTLGNFRLGSGVFCRMVA